MAKKTIQEAVKFLVVETMKINTESAKWKFKAEDIEKVMAVTKQNTIEHHMLTIMRNNALNADKPQV
jgi:hypothetical protein